MRLHRLIDHVLGNRSKIRILRFLARETAESSIRDIAKAVRIAPNNVARSLNDLKQEGILKIKRTGRSHIYSLNRDNVFVSKALVPFFDFEKNIFARLSEELSAAISFPYESIILFGSMARGDERPKSDIDIAVIIGNRKDKPRAENELTSIGPSLAKNFGNQLSPAVFSADEFRGMYAKNKPLALEIYRQGRVLSGKTAKELLLTQ